MNIHKSQFEAWHASVMNGVKGKKVIGYDEAAGIHSCMTPGVVVSEGCPEGKSGSTDQNTFH